MTCENKVQLEVETSTPPYSRETTVHATDVRCPRCGVGGFKENQLPDHWLIDCG